MTLTALLLGAGLMLGTLRERYRGKKSVAPPSVVAASTAGRPSLAVVDIENKSGRAEGTWLETALAELLTAEMAAGHALRVSRLATVRARKTEYGIARFDRASL